MRRNVAGVLIVGIGILISAQPAAGNGALAAKFAARAEARTVTRTTAMTLESGTLASIAARTTVRVESSLPKSLSQPRISARLSSSGSDAFTGAGTGGVQRSTSQYVGRGGANAGAQEGRAALRDAVTQSTPVVPVVPMNTAASKVAAPNVGALSASLARLRSINVRSQVGALWEQLGAAKRKAELGLATMTTRVRQRWANLNFLKKRRTLRQAFERSRADATRAAATAESSAAGVTLNPVTDMQKAVASNNPATHLEGQVAKYLGERGLLKDVQRNYKRQTNRGIQRAQIDVVGGRSREYMIEVTTAKDTCKVTQANKHAALTQRPVIVYAPHLSVKKAAEIARAGHKVARTLEELAHMVEDK